MLNEMADPRIFGTKTFCLARNYAHVSYGNIFSKTAFTISMPLSLQILLNFMDSQAKI